MFHSSCSGDLVTASTAPPATSDPVDRLEDVRALSDLLPRFMRMAQALKAQLSTEGRERAALVLLFPIHRFGPVRQGALADLVHADPSTVSRHVAALVDRGLVRRVADESDGRASRLVVTDAGSAALQELCAERESRLGRLTAAWDDADLAALTRLLGRLLDDFQSSLTGLPTGQDQYFPPTPAPRGNR
jgi:DNA-binding MarR family transcriptional regulator